MIIMTSTKYSIICFCTLIIGFILFAIQKEYIIFNFGPKIIPYTITHTSQKKSIPLVYWHNNEWRTEQVPLLISQESPCHTLQQIVSQWLQLMHEEQIISTKTTLQSALLNYDQQELFISFDRIPWNKESSTYEKWMFLEGLLKTIKINNAAIKKIRFLLDHAPLDDTYLDFTNSWPIDGFE